MLKISDLIVAVTKDLPGSIGAAQVGQVTKAVLDKLAMEEILPVEAMLAKRRRAIIRKMQKAAVQKAKK